MPIDPKAWRDQIDEFLKEVIPTQRGFARELLLEEGENPNHPVPLLRTAVARYEQIRGIAERIRNDLTVLIELRVPPLPDFAVSVATRADLLENNTDIALAMAHINTNIATGGTFTMDPQPLPEE